MADLELLIFLTPQGLRACATMHHIGQKEELLLLGVSAAVLCSIPLGKDVKRASPEMVFFSPL